MPPEAKKAKRVSVVPSGRRITAKKAAEVSRAPEKDQAAYVKRLNKSKQWGTWIDRVRYAGNHHMKVRFVYRPKTRKYKSRAYSVEPYEFNGNILYAYHPVHENIHAFIIPRIVKNTVHIVEGSKGKFNPRWPIKLQEDPWSNPRNAAVRERQV